MKINLKGFLVVLILSSCTHNKNEDKFQSYLSAIGKDPTTVTATIDSNEWEYNPEIRVKTNFNKAYWYFLKSDPREYIMIGQCNESNRICEISYSITKEEFLNLPPKLRKMNFELLDTTNGKIIYVKNKSYNIMVQLLESCKSVCHYRVYISEIKLPDNLKRIIDKRKS